MFVCAIPKLDAWAEPGTPEGAFRSHLWLAAHEIHGPRPIYPIPLPGEEKPHPIIDAGCRLSEILAVRALEVRPARLAVLLAKAEYDFASAMLRNLRARDRRETGINRRAPLARWGQ